MTAEGNATHDDAWFPGRLIGGAALIAGPIAWCAGLLLRYLALRDALTPEQLAVFADEPFAAPAQLAAYASEPALLTAAYAVFFAGAILLWPAVVTLAQIIAAGSPHLAYWGGTLLVFGLFGRAYHAGVDQAAFQLTEVLGLEQATNAVSESYVAISYGPWWVPVTASACQYLGALLLAVAAYRSATFGVGRSLVFLWAGVMWGGVLKASHLYDVVRAGLLCIALVPLGVAVLRGRVPALRTRSSPASHTSRPRLLSW